MNLLHPVYHSILAIGGSRIDVESPLPVDLEREGADELLDIFSEAPRFVERLSPVGVQVGNELVRGKNWTEMMLKNLQIFVRIVGRVTMYVQTTMRDGFRERGMVPFLSLCIDPGTLHRLVEYDYDAGENIYGKLSDFFSSGILSIPLHSSFLSFFFRPEPEACCRKNSSDKIAG